MISEERRRARGESPLAHFVRKFMPNISITDIKSQVFRHPRIVSRLPPHFKTTSLAIKDPDICLGPDNPLRKLIKMTLDRVSGRIFVDADNVKQLLTLGFENDQDLSFFLLILPENWQEK